MNRFLGYPLGKEDKPFLAARSAVMDRAYCSFAIPEMVDPWTLNDKLEPTEDQLQMGACQGNSLTETIEYCDYVANAVIRQFSRLFAYLGSQKQDGIEGDQGSTLTGGSKLLSAIGCCLEETCPYVPSYPRGGWRSIPQAAWDAAQSFKLKSHTEITSQQGAEGVRQFIGGGAGIVQIGIKWFDGMTPDSNGCIRSFRPPASGYGGHAVVFCGYAPDDVVKQKSTQGWWAILKNSWGTRWGIRGRAYVDPSAIDAMLRDAFTVMLGRSDMVAPRPRPVPVDWTKPQTSMYA